MLAASLLVFSCTKPFDFEFEDGPAIFLESFPGVEDMVVFNIKPAYSYSNTAVRPDFNPEIIFKVNGKEVPVVLNTGFCMSEKYFEDMFVADYKPLPGDEMTIEVSSEGFRSISARTVIPAPFPERKVGYKTEKHGEEYNVISVSFQDDAETDCAYGMQIYEENITRYDDGIEDIFVRKYAGYQIADDFEFAPASFDGFQLPFDGWHIDNYVNGMYNNLAGWDDDSFNGGDAKLEMVSLTSYEGLFEWVGKNGNVSHNKLILYTMSEEFYNYAVSNRLIYENAGFFAGLAPSNFCYTNIEGGYGAFAGIYCVDTEWITKEFIENN